MNNLARHADRVNEVKESYRKEDWGRLLLEMGWEPYDTESSGRQVARFAAEKIRKLEAEYAWAMELNRRALNLITILSGGEDEKRLGNLRTARGGEVDSSNQENTSPRGYVESEQSS